MSDSRSQRLDALMKSKKPTDSQPPPLVKRERIKAVVLHSATKELSKEDEQQALRKHMKELALQRQRKEEEEQKERRNLEEIKGNFVLSTTPIVSREEDESEDEQAVTLLKPVFVHRQIRQELIKTEGENEGDDKRQREAHELLIEHVRREYQAAVEAKEDQDNGITFDPNAVDDTDNLDDFEEEAAWKLRELLRIKRDKIEREHWEREKMEMERVRNMTEEERKKLDEEKAREWMEQPASQMRFMQKYYHKGAFYMDTNDALLQRDYAQPTGEDASANREILPEVKQVRDFGKKGRTKWTHLVAEDTTAFDYGWGQRKNEANYKLVSKMGGMRGHLDNPAKRSRT